VRYAKLEEIFTFQVKESLGLFDYRAVKSTTGFRLDKRGQRSGHWQVVLKKPSEGDLVLAFNALTRNIGTGFSGEIPAWIRERTLH
jgi:hypothetical protein